MLKTRLVAASLALAFGAMLVGANDAAAQKVATNYDTKTDFTQFKTYKWVDITGATYPNQLMDMQIRQAIDSALATKGMTKADGDSASVYVAYQISVQQSTQYNTFGTGPGMAGGWGWGGGMSTTTPQTINTGTLVVDLYNPATKQLVWQSTASKQMNPSSDAAKNQANLQKAVDKMFKDYPPGADKK
ncbi:MAG TPA: DUF4136 domain-containing protein [Gemmatimonadales bacterium]|nr:DUF4136 domain-containing protein [Gemmatimonadales bacterium]